jgi:osmotically-inducible protein OsmY
LSWDRRAPIVQAGRIRYDDKMRAAAKAVFMGLSLFLTDAHAAEQSRVPADQAVQQNISRALIQAGIDPRRTSVQVVTTSDHVVYLSGLISDRDTIKLAGTVATKTAPSWRVVNNIRASFFDDPNHVSADKTK